MTERNNETTLTRRVAISAGLAGGAAAALLAAPALAQSSRRITVGLTDNLPATREAAERISGLVSTITDRSLALDLENVITGGDGLLAAANGDVDAIFGSSDTWVDVDPAFGLFASCPFGLSPREFEAWVLHGGGQAEWDALGSIYGVKSLIAGDAGARPVGWFKEPVGAVGDLSGRRMRTSGLGAIAAAAAGMDPVTSTLDAVSGAADATDSFGLGEDAAASLQAVFPILYAPAALRPQHARSLTFGAGLWSTLSESERLLIDTCAEWEADQATGISLDSEMRGLNALEQAGVTPDVLDPAVFTEFARLSDEAIDAMMTERSQRRDVWRAYGSFRANVALWTSIGDGAFSVARARALGI